MSPAAPRPLSLAFVAGNKNPQRFAEDASFVYRCTNLAAGLARLGHRVQCIHLKQLSHAERHDVVVLHRPRLSLRLRWWLALWRRRGTRVLADLDDLVFRADLAAISPAVLNRRLPLRMVRRQFDECAAALQRVDGITISTSTLLEECRDGQVLAPGAALHLLPNAVFHDWSTEPAPARPQPQARVIRYLPGTRSHDRDFALIAAPLTECLRRHPGVRLEVVGPLDVRLDLPADRVTYRPRLPFADYARLLGSTWLNLAPLEPTRFNRCKSALKALEAGWWGVPTLSSPLPDTERLLGDAALFCDSLAQWAGRLDAVCGEPALRDQWADGLRERVLQNASLETQLAPWLGFAWPGQPT